MSAYNFFLEMCALSEKARARGSRRGWKKLWRFINSRQKFSGIPELPGEREARDEATRHLHPKR